MSLKAKRKDEKWSEGYIQREVALSELKNAIKFLDQCKAKPRYAAEVGAMNDAYDRLELAARRVVIAKK